MSLNEWICVQKNISFCLVQCFLFLNSQSGIIINNFLCVYSTQPSAILFGSACLKHQAFNQNSKRLDTLNDKSWNEWSCVLKQ
jgi:hypothetical protein